MKKAIVVALLLFFTGQPALQAQKYSSLWKEVQQALDKDLPQSALKTVKKIHDRAARERNEGQRLQALLVQMRLRTELSPDSIQTERAHFESLLRQESDATRKALLHLVLGKIYANYFYGKDEDGLMALHHLNAALEDPEVLHKTSVKNYLPAFTLERNGGLFRHDLLYPISHEVFSDLKTLASRSSFEKKADSLRQVREKEVLEIYRTEGNANASLLLQLESFKRGQARIALQDADYKGSSDYQRLVSLIQQYASAPVAIEAYVTLCEWLRQNDALEECLQWARQGIHRHPRAPQTGRLKNIEAEILQPRFQVSLPKTLLYPKENMPLHFTVTNTDKAVCSLYRIPLTARDSVLRQSLHSPQEVLKRYGKRQPDYLFCRTFPSHKAYETFRDSMTFNIPKAGIYVLKLDCPPARSTYQMLYVSNNRLLSLSNSNRPTHCFVVDAKEGNPVAGAKVYEYDNRGRMQNTYTTGQDGGFALSSSVEGRYRRLFVETHEDCFNPEFSNYQYRYYGPYKEETRQKNAFLYTDRSVYRPGQTVYVNALLYEQNQDEATVSANDSCRFRLLNANNKEIDKASSLTNDYGTASTQFVLPAGCMPGVYSVRLSETAQVRFRVEEYKRPTFYVSAQETDGTKNADDSLRIQGCAKTFSDISIPQTEVTLNVKQSRFFKSLHSGDESFNTVKTKTDEKGCFQFSIPLPSYAKNVFQYYVADIRVLGSDGEEESTQLTIRHGREPLRLVGDWPEKLCKDQPGRYRISIVSPLEQTKEGTGSYRILHNGATVFADTFYSGKSFSLPDIGEWASGKYELEASSKDYGDTLLSLHRSFYVFALSDTTPADTTAFGWFYATGNTLKPDSPTTLQIGTSRKNVTLFYALYSNDQCIECKIIPLSGQTISIPYTYKEEYGDGLVATFAFWKDGELFSCTHSMTKALPQKELTLRWTSFRDGLRPGQKETWTLQVLRPDGRPADAQVMALLYDASLDKFGTNHWPSGLSYSRTLPSVWWKSFSPSGYLSENESFKSKKYRTLTFDAPSSYWPGVYRPVQSVRPLRGRNRRFGTKMQTTEMAVESRSLGMKSSWLQEKTLMAKASDNSVDGASASADSQNEEEVINPQSLRTDFSETAFFLPTLKTDAQGKTSISFTLPESLTAWNFRALAHTQNMSMGRLDTTVTARKQFMVSSNLPRFLRTGDRTTLLATLRNLTDQSLSGKVRVEIRDAETGHLVFSTRLPFSCKANGWCPIAFPFSAPQETGILVFNILAEGKEYSDGERHYLPVLATESKVVNTSPFVLQSRGTHSFSLSSDFFGKTARTSTCKLHIEYSASPLWYVLMALPPMTEVKYENVLELATAYYADGLASYLLRTSPPVSAATRQWAEEEGKDSTHVTNLLSRNSEVRLSPVEETPWEQQADNLSNRHRALASLFQQGRDETKTRDLYRRMASLQQEDGSWSWFRGMPGSFHITLQTAELLVRLSTLTHDSTCSDLVAKAFGYLSSQVEKEVENLKKNKARQTDKGFVLSTDLIRYLDLYFRYRHPGNEKTDKAVKYLSDRLAASTAPYNMYEKALCAVVLQKAGKQDAARLTLQSLMEHTVCTSASGRYFDTDRAPQTSESYKIPTHLAAMEALQLIRANDTATLGEMRTWLLLSKRTTAWNNTLTSANAVYALLSSAQESFSATSPEKNIQKGIVLKNAKGRTLQPSDKTMSSSKLPGYRFLTYHLSKEDFPLSVRIEKSSDNLSWGAFYATYRASDTLSVSTGKDLKVTRTYLHEKEDGVWTPLTEGEAWTLGEHLKVRYTLTAQRDFDYVQLVDAHPACGETLHPLSGYSFSDNCYRVVKDASTAWFFEHLPKGERILEEEIRADRSGTYQSGAVTLQCCYAPEYTGRERSQKVTCISSKQK